MKQVTLNIPDNEFEFFMALVQKFKYKAAENDQTIPKEVKELVVKRKKSAKSGDYMTVTQSNKKLKKKYGF